MKSPITLIGLLLIIVGIAALAYQGFTYTQHQTVAQIGDVKVTADTPKTIYLSPMLGGVILVAGMVLVVVGRKTQL